MGNGGYLGDLNVDAADVTVALMDGKNVQRWQGQSSTGAVTVFFHDFRVDLWEVDRGFAWIEAYPDTGSLGTDFSKDLPLQRATGELLATAEGHDPEKLGTLTVTSGCIALLPEEISGAHVTDADLERGTKVVTGLRYGRAGQSSGNIVLVPVPNGTYEVTCDHLDEGGVFDHPKIGEVHARFCVRRVGD